jgi:hypothetical protein
MVISYNPPKIKIDFATIPTTTQNLLYTKVK